MIQYLAVMQFFFWSAFLPFPSSLKHKLLFMPSAGTGT